MHKLRSLLALVLFLILRFDSCVSQAEAPSLRRSLSSSYAVNPSGSPFFPYCSFNGDPTPDISWSYNGQRLPTDGSQGGPYYIAGTGVLVLSGGSSGVYTCTGVNQFGSASEDVNIIIVTTESAPVYLMPYIWFVYAFILWLVGLSLMTALYCFKSRRAGTTHRKKRGSAYEKSEVWFNALNEEVRIGGPRTPMHWDYMTLDTRLASIDLETASTEYQQVLSVFNRTMTADREYSHIVKIQRIQNPLLYSLYQQKKEIMEQANPPNHPNERQLFHGTDSDRVATINASGFDHTYVGRTVMVYGVGTYFTRDASYSASPAYARPDSNGYRHMYLVRMLTGEYTVGNSSMRAPPPKDPQRDATIPFDSLVNKIQNPTIFVAVHDAQAYPEYLIIFK